MRTTINISDGWSTSRVTADLVPDAIHAALAIENDATWITDDRGYARFPLLRWRSPLEG